MDLQKIRTADQQVSFVIGPTGGLDYIAIYDVRSSNRLKAALSICNTFFICFVLAGGTLVFSSHCNELVISPVEQMITKVSRIAANPLVAAQEEENEAIALEKLQDSNGNSQKKRKCCRPNKKEDILETDVLERTIIKIGALLALGFGEAGSQIIAQNIQGSGSVNPIIPGQKIIAIFGFCDIRNFTDATEILQEGVMAFVNEIGEIVHGIVDQFSGAPNKNIGDAFLLVWKFDDHDVERDQNDIFLKDTNAVHQLADMSVISFLKILAMIKRSRKLIKYKENKQLQERIPNYEVKMGFGLHVGWAIEGAIGSVYKIDASYLSPNVNMASRLEAATKQFGVQLLVSGQLYDILTPLSKKHLRQIDCVTVKGSVEPLELYTCDIDTTNLPYAPLEQKMTKKEAKLVRAKARIARDRFKEMCFTNQLQAGLKFEIDQDLVQMRSAFAEVRMNDCLNLEYRASTRSSAQPITIT